MKNPSPRQREILSLLTLQSSLTIAEIRQKTGSSTATVYREIQALAQQGLVAKIPGGIERVEQASSSCTYCGREINTRLVFVIEQKENPPLHTCCAHCGLMALTPNTQHAMTSDFLYGTLLSANLAWYVINSQINPCCRPSILSFANQQDAQNFSNGFGGEVCDFSAVKSKIRVLMQLSHP